MLSLCILRIKFQLFWESNQKIKTAKYPGEKLGVKSHITFHYCKIIMPSAATVNTVDGIKGLKLKRNLLFTG
jgi:hypothetical protein